MTTTMKFTKGETAPLPVVFDCAPGADPVPMVWIRRPIFDGDVIEVNSQGEAVAVHTSAPPGHQSKADFDLAVHGRYPRNSGDF